MAIVFGLEHWVRRKRVHNFVVTLLPFQNEQNYKCCIVSPRLKNSYAPFEEHEIKRLGLNTVSPSKPYYELYSWRGFNFSVYNCFELTNIQHRGLMRSKLDFLVAIAWNKDTRYYSNIVESSVRDLHCYIVHVNTSQYGDSRITQPKSSEELNIVRVKGGDNTTVLKARLNFDELDDFQMKSYCHDDKRYKPLPAGYLNKEAKKRALNRDVGLTSSLSIQRVSPVEEK